MDIFEFAMEKEKLARDYYRELAERAPNTGLQSILKMLADEEAKHKLRFEIEYDDVHPQGELSSHRD